MARINLAGTKKKKSGLVPFTAIAAAYKLAEYEMLATMGTIMTQREAYDLLIPQEARTALKAAAPYMISNDYAGSTSTQFIGCGVMMTFKKDDIGETLCRQLPANNSLSTTAELLEGSAYHHLVPLLKLRDQVIAIHRKWAVVNHVILALDIAHDAKTIRWLLPAIKTLKGTEGIPDDLDPRFDPPAVGALLPLVREVGVILGAAQFLPKSNNSTRAGHTLHFNCHAVSAFMHNGVKITPASITYDL